MLNKLNKTIEPANSHEAIKVLAKDLNPVIDKVNELETTLNSTSTTASSAEPALGNPDVSGKVLSSTTAGVRSWITDAGEANAATSLGTGSDGETLVGTKSGVNLPFKRIKAGTGIILTSETNDISIANVFNQFPATLTALGSDQQGAAQISTNIMIVQNADDSLGVKLPVVTLSGIYYIYNNPAVSGKALKIYPSTGEKINGGTVNVGVSLVGTESSSALCCLRSTGDWNVFALSGTVTVMI